MGISLQRRSRSRTQSELCWHRRSSARVRRCKRPVCWRNGRRHLDIPRGQDQPPAWILAAGRSIARADAPCRGPRSRRPVGKGDPTHRLHAWSKSDGAQHCFRLIQESSDNLSIFKLAECIRENTDGVYSFALIDESSQMLAVASDLLGSFHVYFRYFSEGIALSNSSALLAALKPLSDLDPLGILEFCSNAVANEDRTIWRSVKKLRGSQILKIDTRHGRFELIAHRPLLAVLNEISEYEDDPVPDVFESISDVLCLLYRSGGRDSKLRKLLWAADLTGGNDSRALMAAIVANHINVGSTVSGAPYDPDVQIGKRLADQLGIRHYPRSLPGPVAKAEFLEALSLTDG